MSCNQTISDHSRIANTIFHTLKKYYKQIFNAKRKSFFIADPCDDENIVQKKFDNFKCLIVGPDVSVNNTALMRIINKFNISK